MRFSRINFVILFSLTFRCAATHESTPSHAEIDAIQAARHIESIADNHPEKLQAALDSINTGPFNINNQNSFMPFENAFIAPLQHQQFLSLKNTSSQLHIATIEWQFHYVNVLHSHYFKLYYMLPDAERLGSFPAFISNARELSRLKAATLRQIMQQQKDNQNTGNERFCWDALERMLSDIDLKGSESGDTQIQQSPVGADLGQGEISCELKEYATRHEDDPLAGRIELMLKNGKKYKEYQKTSVLATDLNFADNDTTLQTIVALFNEAAEINDFQQRIALYSHIIALDSCNATARFNRAVSYLALEKPQQALADLQITQSVNPSFQQLQFHIGLVYMQLGQYKQALLHLNSAVLSDSSAYVHFKRAFCYLELGEYTKAIPDLDRAIAQDTTNTAYLHNRALCYQRLKKYGKALEDYQRIAMIEPDKASAWYNVGLMHWRLRQWQLVVVAWEKCLELDPDYIAAKNYLSRAKRYAK